LARLRKLPHIRVGKKYRFETHDVSRCLGISPTLLEAGDTSLLTPNMLSKLLEVPIATVYTWVNRSGIYPKDRAPHIRLGRYVRFDRQALVHWYQGRRRPRKANQRIESHSKRELYEPLAPSQAAAYYCQVSLRTIRRYCSLGHIRAKKVHNRWIFTVEDLEALFDFPPD
jgi:hypothetical protein